ncbi:MAG: thiamine pyrophosphate-dependent dehydrogenase E1 component subunit alpha [Gemmatimonadota bacterium]
MRRFSAFDPPEYVGWSADADLVAEFETRLRDDERRWAEVEALSFERALDMYRGLLRFRLHDIALQRWVKQGVISKAWLGTGEEAVTIGAVHALDRRPGRDVVGPMIRNAGACHEMGMSVADMLRGYLATLDAPTRGRDLHIGDPSRGVVAPISMVGGLAPVMNGYALAFKLNAEDRVALTWVGDGSTKSGSVHEAFNFAAVQRLPVVFVIQNNQVALGTRLSQHHRPADFSGWGKAYGMPLYAADGNNVLDMYAATKLAVQRCRAGRGPCFVAPLTFRMGGHATHDVKESRETFEPGLFEYWGRRDPIGQYEEYLCRSEPGNREQLERIEAEVVAEIESAAVEALASREHAIVQPAEDPASECYAP